jgi:hypothetical protein
MLVTFKKVKDGSRGNASYRAEGFGTIYLAKSIGEHPDEITVDGLNEPKVKEAKVTLTKEERAAKRAAMTPEDKIAAAKEIARKAAERADKLAARLSAVPPATTGGDAASA